MTTTNDGGYERQGEENQEEVPEELSPEGSMHDEVTQEKGTSDKS